MSVDPSVIRRPGTGTKVGVPQVLLNYAPVGRGPWRLKAFIDEQGHAVTSAFLTVRPVSPVYPLDYLWAVCNSPFANAYAYAHGTKRTNLAGMVRAMPVPPTSAVGVQPVVEGVRSYFDALTPSSSGIAPEIDPDMAERLLLRVDAEILRLYDLPPRLERQLLDIFAGWPRPGVPFTFDRYYPEDFEPCFPLHEYLSEEHQRSTAGELRARHEDITSVEVLAALSKAIEDFED